MPRKKALYTHRINTGITEEQNLFIKKESEKKNKGEGEMIREMFDYYMSKHKK